MAEKLHSHLAFGQTLSMDRYLVRNREEVRLRRREVASLKHKLLELRRRLHRCVGVVWGVGGGGGGGGGGTREESKLWWQRRIL